MPNRVKLTPFSDLLESSSYSEAYSSTSKGLSMTTHHVTLKVEADSVKVIPPTIESESLPLIPIQKSPPDEIIFSSEHTPQSRNSRLVGFERGAMPLQPFVGPREF